MSTCTEETTTASVGSRWSALMLDRAVSLYESVELLVQSAKYEEAMILGRPIFEESLMLQWLAKRQEPSRTAYVTWFDHDSWNDYANSLSQVRPSELPEPVEPLVKHAKWRRDLAVEYADKHRLKRVAFPSANDLAREHLGRGQRVHPLRDVPTVRAWQGSTNVEPAGLLGRRHHGDRNKPRSRCIVAPGGGAVDHFLRTPLLFGCGADAGLDGSRRDQLRASGARCPVARLDCG